MTRAPRSRLSVHQLEDRCVPTAFLSLQLAFEGAPFDPNLTAGAGDVGESRAGQGGGGAGKVSMNDISFTFAAVPDGDKYLDLVGIAGEPVDAGTASGTSGGTVSGRVSGVAGDLTSAVVFVGGWGASSYQYAFSGSGGAGGDVVVDGRIITGESRDAVGDISSTADSWQGREALAADADDPSVGIQVPIKIKHGL